jgi:hypothetical protein
MSEELNKAVEAALETATQDTQAEKTEEVAGSNTETTETEEKEPEIDERTKYALQLLDALENPRTGKQVVENLAKQAGLLQQTERQQEKTIRSIKQIVKEKLGDGGSFIADELGAALEEIIESSVGSLREEFETREQKREAERYAREYEQVTAKLKITDQEAGEISKLVDKFPYSGKVSLEEYLTDLTDLYRGKVAKSKGDVERRQKQQQNLEKRPKTLGVEASEDRTRKGSAKITPKEAVEAALRGERLE